MCFLTVVQPVYGAKDRVGSLIMVRPRDTSKQVWGQRPVWLGLVHGPRLLGEEFPSGKTSAILHREYPQYQANGRRDSRSAEVDVTEAVG